MNSFICSRAFKCRIALFAALAAGIAAPAARAEPLPFELNLIPREAAFFVSVRVGDLWNDPRTKPVRDFLDGDMLRAMEKQTGLSPAEVERVTILVAGIDQRRASEPCFVVTFTKPYNLERLLDATSAMTAEQWRQANEHKGQFAPFPGGVSPPAFPTKKTEAPPKFFKKKKDFDDEPKKEELKPEPKPIEKTSALEIDRLLVQADKNDPDPPFKTKRAKRDLNANYYVLPEGTYLVPINDRNIVYCSVNPFDADNIHMLLSVLLRRSDDGPLSPALELAAGKHTVVAGCNIAAIKAALPRDEMIDVLPLQSLLSSRCASLVMDVGEGTALSLRVDAPDEATAKRVQEVLKAVHVLGLEMFPGLKKQVARMDVPPLQTAVAGFERLLQSAVFEQQGAAVTMTMKSKEDLAAWSIVLVNAMLKVRQAAEHARYTNNMKQLSLAAANYASAYQDDLPFHKSKGKKPLLSWRVTLLPFIEQAGLYNEFHRDEPWDSPHNIKLLEKMPKIYAPPPGVSARPGYTFYRVFTGPHTISEYKIFNIPDGTSNTIMFVEAGEAVPWTKPDEFPFDAEKPLPKLGGHFKRKMIVGMADGSVRMIDLSRMSEKTLKLAIQADDGMPLPSDW